MPKYVFLPPVDDLMRQWAQRLADAVPRLEVIVADDDAVAARELVDADGAYGRLPPTVLPTVERLRLLQSPAAGPAPGYFYPALTDHPVTVCNPRGIYSDHIAQHILMFMLALSRGLPYWSAAQTEGRWDQQAHKRGYVSLSGFHGPHQRRRWHRSGNGADLRRPERARYRGRSKARAGFPGLDRGTRPARSSFARGRFRCHNGAAHARDRRDVGCTAIPGDEAHGVLH